MTNIPQNNTPNKRCGRCKKFLPATQDFFGKDKRGKNGLNYICKECRRTGKPSEHPRKVDGIPEGFKRCFKCHRDFPATSEFFRRGAATKTGLRGTCKKCSSTRVIDDTPEGFKQCNKCKEVLPLTIEYFPMYQGNVRKGKFHARCRKCESKRLKAYNDAHAEEHKRYYQDNKEEILQKIKRHRKINREEINARRRQKYRLNIEKFLAWSRAGWQKRRMRKKSIGGTLTAQQIRDKLKAQQYTCYYCRVRFTRRDNGTYVYHLDHTIPLSRTEAHPRHDVNHIVLSCPHCNLSKKNKRPHEWSDGGRLL